MNILRQNITPVVAALLLFCALFYGPAPAGAQTDAQAEELDSLFTQLKQPVDGDWQSVETRIWKVWRSSGSESMNLLLERGRKAIRDKDYPKAIEHLSALIDLAPDFAEAWNARATAWFLMDEYALSVSDIQHVLALEPRHFGALTGLGMILEEVDQPKNALAAFRAALAIHPFRPDIIKAVKRLEKSTGGTSL